MQAICSQCSANFSSALCLCSFPCPSLCDEAACRSSHSAKPGTHFFTPSVVHFQSAQDVERAAATVQRVQSTEQWVAAQLQDFSLCEEVVSATTRNTISELEEWRDAKLSEIRRTKVKLVEAITAAKGEVLKHLHEAYAPKTAWETFLVQEERGTKLVEWRVKAVKPDALASVLVVTVAQTKDPEKYIDWLSRICSQCRARQGFTQLLCGHHICEMCLLKLTRPLAKSSVTPLSRMSEPQFRLHIQALSDVKAQKQAIGELIYVKIHNLTNSNIAGKLTGMLLMQSVPQLMTICGNEAMLKSMIKQAIEALRKAWQADEKMQGSLQFLKMKDG